MAKLFLYLKPLTSNITCIDTCRNSNGVCCIRLELKSCTLYVFNVYVPCDTNDNEYLQEYNDVLSGIAAA